MCGISGSTANPNSGYRAVCLAALRRVQIWTAPAGGPLARMANGRREQRKSNAMRAMAARAQFLDPDHLIPVRRIR